MNYLKSVIPIIEANYKNFTSVEKNIANFFRNNLQKNVVTEGIENLFINMSRI